MTKISIKNRWNGNIIFEFSKEDNTMNDTLSEAIKNNIDLRWSDLRFCDLRGFDFKEIDLEGIDFRWCDIRGVKLNNCRLNGIDLQGVNFYGVNLEGCYLGGLKIKKTAVFNGLYANIVIAYITESDEARIKIGCFDRTLKEWDDDFWNNDGDYPNDNSESSNLRLMAFETAKKWIEIAVKN